MDKSYGRMSHGSGTSSGSISHKKSENIDEGRTFSFRSVSLTGELTGVPHLIVNESILMPCPCIEIHFRPFLCEQNYFSIPGAKCCSRKKESIGSSRVCEVCNAKTFTFPYNTATAYLSGNRFVSSITLLTSCDKRLIPEQYPS